MQQTRVLVVDDHAVVRSGRRSLLAAESDLDVVGEAANAREAIFEARALQPDVIVLDVVMPGESGIEVLPKLRQEAPVAKARVAASEDPLSDREREVLQRLALGHTNQEIAQKLHISVRTAETHRAHIMQKLGLATRAELVRHAIEHGLLTP